MSELLLALLAFFVASAILIGSAVAIVFRKDLRQAWIEYKAERAARQENKGTTS